MYCISYLPRAIEEYEKSIEWYANNSISAAENFIIEVQECIEIIKKIHYNSKTDTRNSMKQD